MPFHSLYHQLKHLFFFKAGPHTPINAHPMLLWQWKHFCILNKPKSGNRSFAKIHSVKYSMPRALKNKVSHKSYLSKQKKNPVDLI